MDSSVADERSDVFKVKRPKIEKHPPIIYCLAICATVGGALFGYDTGIINGANLLIKEDFELDDAWIEQIVSSAVGAAAVFSLGAGVLADAIGRKTSIMLSAIVFVMGSVIMGVAGTPEMLVTGRVTVGAAIGVVSSVVPVYVSECAPTSIRGCLITLNQLFITLGIWFSSILAGLFQDKEHGWRYMLGLAAIPGIFQFFFFVGLPESPRYVVMKKKITKARAILEDIRGTPDVQEELDEIVRSIEEDKQRRGWKIWKSIFTTPHVRRALFVGCMLQFFQQLCGINTVIYYSANILKSAGFEIKQAIWLSVIPFTVNFVATFIGLWAVEALGRTKVLAASFFACALALLVLVAAFLPAYMDPTPADIKNEADFEFTSDCKHFKDCWECTRNSMCGFCGVQKVLDRIQNGSCVPAGKGRQKEIFASEGRCSENKKTNKFWGRNLLYSYNFCPSKYTWLAIVGLMLFVLGFAPGAGPMPWTINAEIYPLWSRSVANSMATVTNWACNYTVSYWFLTVTKAITTWGTFLAFAVICVIAAIFTMAFVPETKDLKLEEIETLFMPRSERAAALAKLREGKITDNDIQINESEPQTPAEDLNEEQLTFVVGTREPSNVTLKV